MEKYLRALPVLTLTAVAEQTKVMAHTDHNEDKHHENSISLMTNENQAIRREYEIIQQKMIHPKALVKIC
jgi:hypothetical protein